MKTNEEKIDEELTKLYNNYTKEKYLESIIGEIDKYLY